MFTIKHYYNNGTYHVYEAVKYSVSKHVSVSELYPGPYTTIHYIPLHDVSPSDDPEAPRIEIRAGEHAYISNATGRTVDHISVPAVEERETTT